MDKQILEKIMPGVKFDLELEVFTSLKKVSFHHFLATGSLENNPLIDITGCRTLFEILNHNFRVWDNLEKQTHEHFLGLTKSFKMLTPLMLIEVIIIVLEKIIILMKEVVYLVEVISMP